MIEVQTLIYHFYLFSHLSSLMRQTLLKMQYHNKCGFLLPNFKKKMSAAFHKAESLPGFVLIHKAESLRGFVLTEKHSNINRDRICDYYKCL